MLQCMVLLQYPTSVVVSTVRTLKSCFIKQRRLHGGGHQPHDPGLRYSQGDPCGHITGEAKVHGRVNEDVGGISKRFQLIQR